MTTASESDQVVQRRANLEALRALGIDVYPRRFEAATTIDALIAAHGATEKEALESAALTTRIAGRILAIRSFGKATFLVLSDGKSKLQIYLRQDALSEREVQVLKLLEIGRAQV